MARKNAVNENNKLENWKAKEPYRWWWELIIKVLAIIAPFIVVLFSFRTQLNTQKKYETEKIVQLLSHLSVEINQNLKKVNDSSVIKDLGSMRLDIKLLENNHLLTWSRPLINFETKTWEGAREKDYFYRISTNTSRQLSNFYLGIYAYNSALNMFNEQIGKLNSYDSASMQFHYDRAMAFARVANRQLDDFHNYPWNVDSIITFEINNFRPDQ